MGQFVQGGKNGRLISFLDALASLDLKLSVGDSPFFKNLSKLRLSDPFFGLFWVISEVGSLYIANLAIFKI